MDRVTGLDFTVTEINDEGLKKVVTKLPKLTRINLDSTQITDTGLKEVAKLDQLRELDLKNTKQ